MNYRVVYSGRKTLSLCVKDCEVIVKAPYGTKKARIESLVHSHTDWILKHLEKQKRKSEIFDNLTEEDMQYMRQMMLMMYANPLKNQIAVNC